MSVTNRLLFDVTDANTRAASANVGAWVRAGSDGDLITSGDGSADNIATNGFEGLDTRSFNYAYDGTNWDRLKQTNGALWVDIQDATIPIDYSYAEDAAHTTGDKGAFILAVRADTAASTSGTDGDYSGLITNASGRLWVSAIVDSALPAGNNNIGDVDIASVIPGTGATNLGKAEDGAHTSGDVGVMGLAVRHDSLASLAGTDLDYTPLQVNSSGALYVVNTGTGDDFALANVAIQSTATAVSTSAIDISTPLADRKYVYLANNGNIPLFVGESGVSTSSGFPLFPGQQLMMRAGDAVDIEVIGGTGASSEDLRVMELS